MENGSNNSEILKKYAREIRELIDNDTILNEIQIESLQKKYDLSQDDIDKINNLASTLIGKASDYFELGDWENAITNIEEAFYKNPTSLEILELYYNIVSQSRKLLGKESKDKADLDLILKRIQSIDKNRYKILLKKLNSKEATKFNKFWLFSLLLLIIPLAIILIPKPAKMYQPTEIKMDRLNPGEIRVETDIIHHVSDIELMVEESSIKGSTETFVYNLKFYIYSNRDNISYIGGTVKLFDSSNTEIFYTKIESPASTEYYLNEKIPFSITINSLRNIPNIDRALIEISNIVSSKGVTREEKPNLELIYPTGVNWELEIEILNYSITKGVISDYLTFEILVKNRDRRKVNRLEGYLEWVDEYSREVSRVELTLLDNKNLPIDSNQRVVKKIFEIGEITSTYRFVISEIE